MSTDNSDPAALARAKLDGSAITPEQAKTAHIVTLTPDQSAKLYAGAPKAPCLQLNYCTPFGKAIKGMYRLRLLAHDKRRWRTVDDDTRYLQPPDTTPEIYFPIVKGINWAKLLSDPTQRLVLTEGELKALCATVHDIPCIGLGGVWSWRSAKKGMWLHPSLNVITWKDRDVHIAYDSDVSTKPQVTQALLALAKELGKLGAKVYDAGLLPLAGEGEDKVGIDDLIVARGARAFLDHLEHNSTSIDSVNALHEFNRRYIYIRSMNMVVDTTLDLVHRTPEFIANIAANEKFKEQTVQANGTIKTAEKSTAKSWVEWSHRAEANVMDYVPGAPRVLLVDGKKRYNTWKGWGCKPTKGNLKPWNTLLGFMFDETEQDALKWFVQWCAWPLQHPGEKLFSAVAVWGSQGTGKTLIGETLLRIYGSNGSMITQSDLESDYTDWADSKQFVLGDEVTGNASRRYADKLKGLLTSTNVSINKKYQPRYELPNRVNFYFTSNHCDAFFMDADDRRFMIVRSPDKPLGQAFYAEYDEWMRGDGPSALFHHLMQVDLKGFNPHAPAPYTQAKAIMIEDSRITESDDWAFRLRSNPEAMLRMAQINGHRKELFSSHELLVHFDPQGVKRTSAVKLGHSLRRAGFKYANAGNPVRLDGAPLARYWIVFEEDKWGRSRHDAVCKHLETTMAKDKY